MLISNSISYQHQQVSTTNWQQHQQPMKDIPPSPSLSVGLSNTNNTNATSIQHNQQCLTLARSTRTTRGATMRAFVEEQEPQSDILDTLFEDGSGSSNEGEVVEDTEPRHPIVILIIQK